jgi:hypothetical protein
LIAVAKFDTGPRSTARRDDPVFLPMTLVSAMA